MFDFIEGRIACRSAARLVLDVGGMGYDLAVPPGAAFPAEGRLRVWTHLVVREDAHQLYGFPDAATRDLFRALLTVGGVGPRMALGVLSGLPRPQLLAAILAGDLARLTAIKGIGRKTAEQILLDLRDKAALLAAGDGQSAAPGDAGDPGLRAKLEDAVGALVSIGYSPKEARHRVERAASRVDTGDLQLLVRSALRD